MAIHAPGGINKGGEDLLNAIQGYLGTWVTVVFTPANSQYGVNPQGYTGRFVGIHVKTSPVLVFEGYTVLVDGGKRFDMVGLNEDKEEETYG